MAITILEIIENAEYQLDLAAYNWPIAKDQIHNAMTLLHKGYDIYDKVDVDALAAKYGSLENVPEKGD